jgi:YggT family protein
VSGVVAAIGREDIAHYVSTLITVYIVLIFIRILMGWFTRIPYYRWLDVFLRFVTEVTDPYLRIFRRFVPPLGPLDLSPMVAIFVLFIVRSVLVSLLEGL